MARKFRFRLEVVQKQRRQAQDAQRRAVAKAIRAVRSVEERTDRLTRELRDAVDRSRDVLQPGSLDMVSLRGHQIYRGRLHREIMQSSADLVGRRAELEQRRETLAEASKRLKVIENLRDRQWQRHIQELRKEEQAGFDEAASQVHMRQRHRARREARVS